MGNRNKSTQFVLIGAALLMLSGILLYVALDLPRISDVAAETGTWAEQTGAAQETAGTDAGTDAGTQAAGNTAAASSTRAASSAATQAEPVIVNINTATLERLKTLNGIGDTKAAAIIAYREENGGFSSLEELMNVKGIGEATFEKILPYVTL
ncbi:MAG: helix-hairpin-helix domain-containing protein [Clostridiales bacterium]|nr:helix-hairpin-helix domain-containing protein [Clostridiales bacterium]